MPVLDIFNDGSCVAYWTFDKNANDLSGNYNGSWVGNEQYTNGRFGFGALFDGNSYITLPNGIESYFQENKEFSITGWFRYDSFDEDWSRIFDFSWYIDFAHKSTTNTLIVEFMPRAYLNDYSLQKVATTTINLGVLYFFAIIWDKTNLKLYVKDIDGNELESEYITHTISWKADSPINAFGKSSWTSNGLLKGMIDNIRIFNRALTDDEIHKLYYSEYKRVLFEKSDSSIWYFDFSSNSWKQVTSDKNTLTADDFYTYGMFLPIYINKEKLELLDTSLNILFFTEESNFSVTNLNIKVIPNDKLVVQKSLLSLADYESINSITINTSGTGNIKFLVSRDLVNWYAWDGTNWKLVKTGNLDYTNKNDIDLVSSQGNDPSVLSALTWNEWQQLYGDTTATPDYIAFAFALQNNTETDNIVLETITINATPKSFWKDVTNQCEILQGYSSIIVKFNLDGDFKINYID